MEVEGEIRPRTSGNQMHLVSLFCHPVRLPSLEVHSFQQQQKDAIELLLCVLKCLRKNMRESLHGVESFVEPRSPGPA